MRPFAIRFSRPTEWQRYKTAIVGAWGCGALSGVGIGVGLSLLPAYSKPTLTEGMAVGLIVWVAVVAGVTLVGRFIRFLMRHAPAGGDAQPATQTLTSGCSSECYGWRRPDDPNVGGCGGECEGLRQQPQPEPNHDTR